MFGGRGRQAQVKPSDTHLCYSGEIVYAWARTGQAKPIGLDFADTPVKGDGFEVGPRSRFEWLAIQIHYQQLGSTDVLDQSGVELTFGPAKPQRPLAVTLMASWSLKIPPQIKTDECVQCRVVSGGTAVAWRNHAHRLARDVYSEHYGFNGEPKSHVGLISAQQPQIFRVMPTSVALSPGDTLLLHCLYDAKGVDKTTFLGVDERTREMCNQYLMATTNLRISCSNEMMRPDTAGFGVSFSRAALDLQARGGGVGQVTGLALDEGRSVVWAFHRASNTFESRRLITSAAIVGLSYEGKLRYEIGKGLFTVPHGLSVDHNGRLWATDVAQHRVFRIDPAGAGKVELTLGSGQPGGGPRAFRAPTDVAVDARTGRVFVADGYGNSRVAVFSYDGVFEREWGSAGSADGQFRVPHSIAIDRRGLVYVADRENSRVQVFDQAGGHRATWNSRHLLAPARHPYSRHVSSITYHPTLDVFAVAEGDTVSLRSPSGCTLNVAGENLKWPHDAVVLPSDSVAGKRAANRSALASTAAYTVFVAELDAKRVSRYTWRREGTQSSNHQFSMYG